jgi:hypothetical protein
MLPWRAWLASLFFGLFGWYACPPLPSSVACNPLRPLPRAVCARVHVLERRRPHGLAGGAASGARRVARARPLTLAASYARTALLLSSRTSPTSAAIADTRLRRFPSAWAPARCGTPPAQRPRLASPRLASGHGLACAWRPGLLDAVLDRLLPGAIAPKPHIRHTGAGDGHRHAAVEHNDASGGGKLRRHGGAGVEPRPTSRSSVRRSSGVGAGLRFGAASTKPRVLACRLAARARCPVLTRRCLPCSVAAAIWIERSSGRLLAAGGGDDAAAGDDVVPMPDGERFSKSAFDYYMDLWKLFYAAYLLLPLAL